MVDTGRGLKLTGCVNSQIPAAVRIRVPIDSSTVSLTDAELLTGGGARHSVRLYSVESVHARRRSEGRVTYGCHNQICGRFIDLVGDDVITA